MTTSDYRSHPGDTMTSRPLEQPRDDYVDTYEIHLAVHSLRIDPPHGPVVRPIVSPALHRAFATTAVVQPRPADPDDGPWTLSDALLSRGATSTVPTPVDAPARRDSTSLRRKPGFLTRLLRRVR